VGPKPQFDRSRTDLRVGVERQSVTDFHLHALLGLSDSCAAHSCDLFDELDQARIAGDE
jgi:hypothetical protein